MRLKQWLPLGERMVVLQADMEMLYVTRVTASINYRLASSQTKFALLVRQSIQLIIMKQYLNLKFLQASSVCSIFTWTFQEFQDRRLFNFYGISMRNTSKVHLTYSLLRRMRGWKNYIEKPRIGGTN